MQKLNNMKIELKNVSWECSDGCCYFEKTEVLKDGVKIGESDLANPKEILEIVLSSIGLKHEIIETHE